MGSVNRAFLVGNLGKDAELRFVNASPVAGFSLATTERFTGRDGQKQEKTEWHRIVVWGKQAETLQPYLKKGKQVCVEGRLETREWTGNDGVKQRTTEIKADRITLLGSREEGQGAQTGNARPVPVPAKALPVPAKAETDDFSGPVYDDDIPF